MLTPKDAWLSGVGTASSGVGVAKDAASVPKSAHGGS